MRRSRRSNTKPKFSEKKKKKKKKKKKERKKEGRRKKRERKKERKGFASLSMIIIITYAIKENNGTT